MTDNTVRNTSAIAAVLAALNTGIVQADSIAKQAVAYFQTANGLCKLVLTYVEPSKGNEGIAPSEATRVEAAGRPAE